MAGTTVPVNFASSDSGGAGLQDTSLYVKLPGSGTYVDAGLSPITGVNGTFIYAPPNDGAYEFYTRASDQAGNVEAVPGLADTTTLFNVDENSSFTQAVVAGVNILVFPMTNDLDVTVTLTGVTGAGSLVVSRTTPLASPPAYFRFPDKLLDESLLIDGSGLPAFTDGTIEWAFDPANDGLGGDPVNQAFRFEGETFIQAYGASRAGSILTIPNVTGFSTWYAGNGIAVPIILSGFSVE
jgi:hypothetical protein